MSQLPFVPDSSETAEPSCTGDMNNPTLVYHHNHHHCEVVLSTCAMHVLIQSLSTFASFSWLTSRFLSTMKNTVIYQLVLLLET